MKARRFQPTPLPWKPKDWLSWFVVGLLWLGTRFYSLSSAKKFGQKASLFLARHQPLKRRKQVVRVNLALAFPELTHDEREQLVEKNLRATGAFFTEAVYLTLKPRVFDSQTLQVIGDDVLEKAKSKGKNILFLSLHTTSLEAIGAMIGQRETIDVIYRKQRNPVVDYLLFRSRAKMFNSLIDRDDTETIIKLCRDTTQQRILWSIPDQDFGAVRSAFVPFLGCAEAATLTAPSRLASRCDMTPIFVGPRFDEENENWVVEYKEIENYPTEDPVADACTMNEVFGKFIRSVPHQYYWVHRRFKTLPNGEKRDYFSQDKLDEAEV